MKSNPIWIKNSGTHLNGLEFSGDYDAALYIDKPLENITIENCDFSFCAYPLLVNAPIKNLIFRNNKGYMLFGDGCCINTTSGQSENVWIHDNYIHAPFSNVIPMGFGISLSKTKNAYIMRNTIINAKWQGLHIENDCDNFWIFENQINGIIGNLHGDKTIWTSGRAGIWVHRSKNMWIVENSFNNCVDSGVYLAGENTTVLVTGNEILNPGMYGIYISNYELAPNIYVGPCNPWTANKISYESNTKIKIVGRTGGVVVTQ